MNQQKGRKINQLLDGGENKFSVKSPPRLNNRQIGGKWEGEHFFFKYAYRKCLQTEGIPEQLLEIRGPRSDPADVDAPFAAATVDAAALRNVVRISFIGDGDVIGILKKRKKKCKWIGRDYPQHIISMLA